MFGHLVGPPVVPAGSFPWRLVCVFFCPRPIHLHPLFFGENSLRPRIKMVYCSICVYFCLVLGSLPAEETLHDILSLNYFGPPRYGELKLPACINPACNSKFSGRFLFYSVPFFKTDMFYRVKGGGAGVQGDFPLKILMLGRLSATSSVVHAL